MYSYPFVEQPTGWPFASRPTRSRPSTRNPQQRASPYSYGMNPYEAEEADYVDPRLQAARELEKQRIAQEYARRMQQSRGQNVYGGEEGLDDDDYTNALAQELQRQRIIEAKKQQQQQKRMQQQQELLERERLLRQLEAERAEQQKAELLRRRQWQQAQAEKQRQYAEYLKSLEEQQRRRGAAPQETLEDKMDEDEPNYTPNDEEEAEEEEAPEGFYHPFYGFIPAHMMASPRGRQLRRSRSLSPPKQALPSTSRGGPALNPFAFFGNPSGPAPAPVPAPASAQGPAQPSTSTKVPVRKVVEYDDATKERAAIKIQAAVRAFLVRSQRIIPKLKEIASVRKIVKKVTENHQQLIQSWRALAGRIEQFRSGENRTVFDLPEKKDRTRLLAYDEEVLRALISLDNVAAGRSELVRETRRQLVKDIQVFLQELDTAKATLRELPQIEADFAALSSAQQQEQESLTAPPSEPSASSNDMEVDTHQDNATEASVAQSEVMETEQTSTTESSSGQQLSAEEIQLILRTLAANNISLDDLRPSATPRQFTLTTLSL